MLIDAAWPRLNANIGKETPGCWKKFKLPPSHLMSLTSHTRQHGELRLQASVFRPGTHFTMPATVGLLTFTASERKRRQNVQAPHTLLEAAWDTDQTVTRYTSRAQQNTTVGVRYGYALNLHGWYDRRRDMSGHISGSKKVKGACASSIYTKQAKREHFAFFVTLCASE